MIFKKNKLTVDGFGVDFLAKKFGTPIYCYSEKKIKNNILNFKNYFKKINPLICYAVKANSNNDILKEIKNYNLGADVVSIGELMKALKAGIKPHKIVFSGVGKTSTEIEYAIIKNIAELMVLMITIHRYNVLTTIPAGYKYNGKKQISTIF